MKRTVLLIIAAISFILMLGEAETIALQFIWTGGSLAVFAASMILLDKYCLTDEEREEEV